jgi:ketosteroid isomerase-like protein
MIIISIAYLAFDSSGKMVATTDENIFEDAKFKVAYDSNNNIQIFVNAKNNELSKFKVSEGQSIPEADSVVIGNQISANLKKEGKFSKTGNHLNNYFGINTTIEGVISKRDDIVDSLTFVSSEQFGEINGEESAVFSKMKNQVPKFFYKLIDDNTSLNLRFREGRISEYTSHNLNGEVYEPLILGYKEAQLMKKEKLFEEPGDRIKNFFGRNFIISGVLEETNSSMDYLHFVPLGEEELTNS